MIAGALAEGGGEVRAFVTSPDAAQELRELGIKVAVGDVSDASHIEGAAHQAHSAVILAEAGRDDRERSFAKSFEALVDAWAEGLQKAGVRRIIWVGPEREPPSPIATAAREAVSTGDTAVPEQAAAEVVRLDGLARLE